MTIEEMRSWIRKPYPHPTWQARVDRMPPRQVVAVYNAFKEEGRFKPRALKKVKQKEEYHQMTLWDYIFDQAKEMENVKPSAVQGLQG